MKLSLFKIEQEYINMAEQIIDNGGELTPELETALQINKEQLETKGQCYGFIVRQLDAEVEIIDAEISRLTALNKSRNKTVDRLKETLTKAMDLYAIEKIETPTLKISFRNSQETVVDEKVIDKEWCTSKVVYTPDKKRIKEAIEEGITILGAEIKDKRNIQIK